LFVAKVCQSPHRTRGHKADIATPAAITAVGSTSWFEAQPFEADATSTAISGFHRNFGFIGKVPTRQSFFS
jgi:hypothetical protein